MSVVRKKDYRGITNQEGRYDKKNRKKISRAAMLILKRKIYLAQSVINLTFELGPQFLKRQCQRLNCGQNPIKTQLNQGFQIAVRHP